MEIAHVGDRGGLQVGDRADTRALVGMDGEGVLRDRQGLEASVGIGQHPLAQFLLDHSPLRLEVGVVDHQRAHPLGLSPQQALQVVGGDHVEVVGEVVGGGGVVQPAHVLGQTVHVLGRHVLGGLEHHVLEQVGEARTAHRVVLGADAVEDLDVDEGCGVIDRGHQLQPVGQGALLILEWRDHDGGGSLGRGGWSLGHRDRPEQQGGGGQACDQTLHRNAPAKGRAR